MQSPQSLRTFCSEYEADYNTYTFSYAVYCVKDDQSQLTDIYSRGFLPYTGNYSIQEDIFYLARSLRIDLERFHFNSENRRINRKNEAAAIQLTRFSKDSFDVRDVAFQAFCTNYADDKFVGGSMTPERLSYVLSRELLTDILVFQSAERVLGYVFAAISPEAFHYWYCFYDTSYPAEQALGKYIMANTVAWAKAQGLKHVYLGTCYNKKALYKVRDHEGIEFFDGMGWNTDRRLLESLCFSDEAEAIGTVSKRDHFKLPPEDARAAVYHPLLRLSPPCASPTRSHEKLDCPNTGRG